MSLPLIAIVDCAIHAPSIGCFNRLVFELENKLEYHWPSHHGFKSLSHLKADAFIVLGSFSNVEDRLDWQRDLAIFLDNQLQQNKPVLGICFAHQLMADFYGAKVVAAPISHSGAREIHTHNLKKDSLLKPQYRWIVQHSYEVQQLPEEFICLASSPACQNEIIIHQRLPFIGVQAHPEASISFVHANFAADQQNMESQVFDDGMNFIKLITHQMNERILHNSQKPLLSLE